MVIISDTAKFVEVRTTFEKIDEARYLAAKMLDARLVACVKISEVESSYVFEGALRAHKELQVCMVTCKALLKRCEKFIKANHPYKVPQIIAMPLFASKDYGKWVKRSVR